MTFNLREAIQAATGQAPVNLSPLLGGCIGQVYRAEMPGNAPLAVKVSNPPDPRLRLEGWMLGYLRQHTLLPLPEVMHSDDHLLLMTFLEGESRFEAAAQAHAAELVAGLHSLRADHFGLERDTLLGGLYQPNPPTPDWIPFFRDQRLLYMAGEAHQGGLLPARLYGRLKTFAGHLERFLEEPEHPSLIHGDLWTTNLLATGGRITGFLDPAIYYAHPEIELAFTTLFGTFDAPFFERYHALRPIEPGFFEVRRDIYNLYPLLAHVRLFGAGYVGAVERILSRLGY
jgi:fructosamine-3-kinase